MLGCLRESGWLNSNCLDRPLAFVVVVQLLEWTTLYLISCGTCSVTERAIIYTVDRDIFAGKIFRLLNFRVV